MPQKVLEKSVFRTLSQKKLDSLYKYKHDDLFYDVESLSNFFSVSQVYPKGPEDYKKIIVTYIDDGYTDLNGVHHDKIINSKEDLNTIKHIIFETNKSLDPSVPIIFEDLNIFNPDETQTAELGIESFMKRFGLAYKNDYNKSKVISAQYYPTRQTDDELYEAMVDVKKRLDNNDYVDFEEEPMPMANMDITPNLKHILNYDEEKSAGLRFGYNSTNYDLTILAYLMDLIPLQVKGSFATPQNRNLKPIENVITANKLRQFNNLMFDKFKNNMSRALVENTEDFDGKTRNNYRAGYAIRSQWLATNRFLDVSKFNEKQAKVSLKRLSGFLGFPIIESDLLDESASHLSDVITKSGKHIPAIEVLGALLAYNISDDLNTQRLFENDVYQNNFKVKNSLLKEYPQTVYDYNPASKKPYHSGFQHVKRNPLTADATSAKFIEMVIAPYKPLVDIPTVSFMYPSKDVAKRLGVKQTNILEDSMAWAEANVPNGREAFQPIYDQYKAYEGRSANPTLPNQGVELVSDIDLSQFDNVYYYRDANGNKTSSISVFTIGGIHGAEVKMDIYTKDVMESNRLRGYQRELEERFNSPESAYAYRGESVNPATNKPYRLGEVPITMSDGEDVTVKSLLKSGSSQKHATWKTIPEPTLFDATGVRNKYRFTSSDPAQHEDFSSYYPALLSNLQVFYDAATGVDVYNEIYKGRLNLKKKLKTLTWGSQEYRDLDDMQTAFKLLLNAASGAADPKSPEMSNNIRKNNAIVSMRIIGQLFAWRIGQAQALQGARVPSVNTDGLYIMGISSETNQRVLDEVTKPMLIKVDPEELALFVSKDTNNRLEVDSEEENFTPTNSKISARGGILTSFNGPTVVSNIDHPAIIDYALSQYLAFVDHAVDKEFDRKLGRSAIESIGAKKSKDEIVRFFQWIVVSKPSTPRIIFKETLDIDDGGNANISSFEYLQHVNRIFLTKPQDQNHKTVLSVAAAKKLTPAELKKLNKTNQPVENDPVATKILSVAHVMPVKTPTNIKKISQTKVTKMPDLQNITIDNRDVLEIAKSNIFEELDIEAYLNMLEDAFETFHN